MQSPDPKDIQITLTGFLEEKTAKFMHELWTLLLSAQESPSGVPKEIIDAKKESLKSSMVKR